jgi:uracil-DNA glycosylase family 4
VLDRFLAGFGYTMLPRNHRQYAYHTDVAHYFPGRHEHGSGDIKPSADEVERSRGWLETELLVINPVVVVALGKQPTAVFLERYGGGLHVKRLIDVAATPIHCRVGGLDMQLIAVHHPSGAFQHALASRTYERAAAHVRRFLGN